LSSAALIDLAKFTEQSSFVSTSVFIQIHCCSLSQALSAILQENLIPQKAKNQLLA